MQPDIADVGSASQPCSPVPAETIEDMISRSPIPPGLDVPPKKQPYACRDFINGKCNRGEKCKFLHVIESRTNHELNYVTGIHPFILYHYPAFTITCF